MVLQCDVHIVVMLTETSQDSGATSCIPYWPTKVGATAEVGSDFKITHLSSATYNDAYTTTTLKLVHTPTNKTRTIWHLQYVDWGDTGCPTNVRAFLNFLEELSALRNHITNNAAEVLGIGRNKNPPVLVHCSAGVGRSGVAILTDILLYCVDHNVDIDIPKMLTHLRQQRMLMVQTVAQYKFVHTALIHYLKQSRLI
jgi:tyrosine-protein phosphatase non-receptor type 14/21